MLSGAGFGLPLLRYLGDATNSLGRTYARLSSGSRINSASDDAAGVAIADRLRTNARTSAVAIRNVSDGLSAISIASGGLEQQSLILQRMLELGQQSANGGLSDSQRGALNTEYLTLMREYVRIADTTEFNEQSLLRGLRSNAASSVSLQVGISGDSSGLISFYNPDTSQYSGVVDTDLLETVSDGGADWNDFLSADLFTLEEILARFPTVAFKQSTEIGGEAQTELLVFFGLETSLFSSGAVGVGTFVLNQDSGLYDYQENGTLVALESADTTGLQVAEVDAFLGFFGIDVSALRFQSGSVTGQSSSVLEFTGIESSSRATSALEVLRTKLDKIALDKAALGAAESRLGATVGLLASNRENYLAAEGRIRDADVASEAANLVRQQILQQSSVRAIELVNQNREIVLSLLS